MEEKPSITMTALRYEVGKKRSVFHSHIPAGLLERLVPDIGDWKKRHSESSVNRLKDQLLATDLFLRYPLLLAVDSKIIFDTLDSANKYFGIMKIPLDSQINLLVGSLRYRAIIAVIAEKPGLAKAMIPISCYDKMKKDQIFDDKNLYYSWAEQRTNRRELALDDEYGRAAQKILAKRPELEKLVHNKETRLTQGSKKIFTIMSFRMAVKKIHERYNKNKDTKASIDDLMDNMGLCLETLILGLLAERSDKATGKERRQKLSPGYLGPNIILKVLGSISGELMAEHPDNWKIKLKKIKNYDEIIDDIGRKNVGTLWDRYDVMKRQASDFENGIKNKVDLVITNPPYSTRQK